MAIRDIIHKFFNITIDIILFPIFGLIIGFLLIKYLFGYWAYEEDGDN